jgi:hypothetical protein
MRPGVIVLVVAVVVVGAAIVLAAGWRSLVVYGFLVGLAGLLAYGAALGGAILTSASRGRFDRNDGH